ncbi:DUF3757 domain-containing protein [Pseudomonas sp. D2-30]|uniref:DUF3757 domain-containing protein n=1 Tax=unclassified Pseudomonas TaxID=196821 RepID=UPI003DAA101D
MFKIRAGGVGVLLGVIGQVNAGEITCPAATDIHRNIEAVEDVYFVEGHDEFEWRSENLVDLVNPRKLLFEGAEYVQQEESEDEEELAIRTTITCRYGDMNLVMQYPHVQEPTFSPWINNNCKSQDVNECQLINADYFQVSFD